MNALGLTLAERKPVASSEYCFPRTGIYSFPGDFDMRFGRAVTTLSRYVAAAISGEWLSVSEIGPTTSDDTWRLREREVVEAAFDEIAERWISATAAESSFIRLFSHEAYLEILTLGRSALPLLLERLNDEPERWVGALRIITKEPIADNAASADEAVAAWRAWGSRHGYWL